MWRKNNYWLLLLIYFMLITGCSNHPGPPRDNNIGKVRNSQGYPRVIRNQRTYILAKQSRIYKGDIIDTNDISRISIRLGDGSELFVGANTHLVIHEYDLLDDEIIRTTFSKGSLRITRFGPTTRSDIDFFLKTPVSELRMNNSNLWCRFENNALSVVLLKGRDIYMSNEHGEVEIENSGFGVSVLAGSAPQQPLRWSPKRLKSAVSDTHF